MESMQNPNSNGNAYVMVWLADFAHDVKMKPNHNQGFRTKYVLLDAEISKFHDVAKATASSNCARVYPEGSHIVAIAALEPLGQHHALRTLADEERVQRDLWRFFVQSSLHGKMSYFRVVRVKLLALPVPLHMAASKWKKRFFAKADAGWGMRNLTSNMQDMSREEQVWWMEQCQQCSPEGVPLVALRLPRPILSLVLASHWTRVAVPDASQDGFFLRAGWDAFPDAAATLQRQLFQGEPCCRLLFSNDDPLEGLKTVEDFQVANGPGRAELHLLLQRVASAFMGCRPCQGEARDRMFLELLAAGTALEDSEADLCRFLLTNAASGGTRRYSVSSLLNYFILSGFLHRDADLREALESCCKLVLPADQANAALSLLHGDGHYKLNVPSASTISRARFKVDVAWMLVVRDQLKACLLNGGVKLFVQTDATFQAGKQYQITILNIVKNMDIPMLSKD